MASHPLPPRSGNSPWELFHILIPAVAAIVLFFYASFFIFLPEFKKGLLDDRKAMIRELVLSAWHMVQYLDMDVDKGKYTLEEAKAIARDHLREMRYGEDGKNYFWINDFQPAMIMHPYRPDLEGKAVGDFTDPTGKKLFREVVKVANEQGQGYVSYLWQWKDRQKQVVPKLSFIKSYEPWGWIIGTGIYLDEVEMQTAAMINKLVAVSVVMLILVALISARQIHQTLGALRLRKQAEARLMAHQNQLESIVEERTTELSHANQVLQESEERFRGLSEAAFEGVVIIEDNTIVDVNTALTEMFDCPPSALIGKEISALSPPAGEHDDDDRLQQKRQAYDSWCRRGDGTLFPVEIHEKMLSLGGRQLRIQTIRDISERKRAEEERERLIADLQQALGEVKTLSGFFPICASCKKIRDDQGYWEQIEAYIGARSQAQFSHSICPDCAKRLYPELVDDDGNLKEYEE